MSPKKTTRSTSNTNPDMAPLLELIRKETTTLAQQQQLIQQQQQLIQQQRQPEQNVVYFKTFQAINPPEF